MKDKLMMVVFVLVLGTILTSSLTIVDQLTAPMIERNAAVKLKSTVLDAFGISYQIEDIDQTFSNNVKESEVNGRRYYISGRGLIGIPFEGNGVWGPITGILALRPNLEEISGIAIMHQEETPGLGSRIAEPEYLRSFVNKRFEPGLKLVAPGRADAPNEIDSISGATMSSQAFLRIINREYMEYESLLEGAR